MANNSVVTQEKLQEFYENKVYPYLNGATHAGCVPVGSRLDGWFPTTPKYYLYCDGAEYLKSDYPELAELLAQVDEINSTTQYVGSDANHFKVPDLRGEFIRGTGINSHTNQGSGAGVGVHQDSTRLPDYGVLNNGQYVYKLSNAYGIANADKVIKRDILGWYLNSNLSGSSTSDVNVLMNVRPTNTSLPQYICYKTHYIDLALDSFPIDITQPTDGQLLMYDATAGRWVNGGHKYSTDEHIVGTWIDGKPIYEVSFSFSVDVSSIVDGTTSYFSILYSNLGISTNIDNIIDLTGLINNSSSFEHYWKSNNTDYFLSLTNQIENSQFVYSRNKASSGYDIIKGTIRYTKTTDTI